MVILSVLDIGDGMIAKLLGTDTGGSLAELFTALVAQALDFVRFSFGSSGSIFSSLDLSCLFVFFFDAFETLVHRGLKFFKTRFGHQPVLQRLFTLREAVS